MRLKQPNHTETPLWGGMAGLESCQGQCRRFVLLTAKLPANVGEALLAKVDLSKPWLSCVCIPQAQQILSPAAMAQQHNRSFLLHPTLCQSLLFSSALQHKRFLNIFSCSLTSTE